ncbi:MAG: cytoplasmic protein [Clostridia bacterium]|nr:cytoplasmic protein [Clostridia bacterium]
MSTEHWKDHVINAHKCCSRNKNALKKSKSCGCFYCLAIFSPEEISDWIVEKNFTDMELTREDLSTACCPYCGTDSVIGDSSGFPITENFLGEMEKYWFGSH